VDDGAELRARITYSTDVEKGEVERTSVASEEEIVEAVRSWVAAVCSAPARPR
jgi:hypothetical protein